MVEESTRLQDIRLERLQDLQNRHLKELKDFDTVSRRHIEGSPRSSARHSYTSGIVESSNRFNQGSPRHSNRSLGTPSSRYPLPQQQPSRESSVSMTSLQASGYNEPPSYGAQAGGLHSNSFSNMSSSGSSRSRQSSMESRNGSAGDRRSYHGPPSNPRR